ncbi:MAG: mechanosensitive ion channel domain-containing protein [Elainellaceae cyanobacterium]
MLIVWICSLPATSPSAIAQAPALTNPEAVDEVVDGPNEQDPICTLSSQSVRVRMVMGEKEDIRTLFCIEAWFQDKSPQERAGRAGEQIQSVMSGRINLQSLGLRQGAALDDVLAPSTSGSDKNLPLDEQSVGLVSDMPSLRGSDRLIFLVTPLDVELNRQTSSPDRSQSQTSPDDLSTVSLAIARFAAVQAAVDQAPGQESWVTFSWGPYWPWRWRRSALRFSKEGASLAGAGQERLFPVHNSGDFYNAAYRSITVTQHISVLTSRLPYQRITLKAMSRDGEDCDAVSSCALTTGDIGNSILTVFPEDVQQANTEPESKYASVDRAKIQSPKDLVELYRGELQPRIDRYRSLYQINLALTLAIVALGLIASQRLGRQPYSRRLSGQITYGRRRMVSAAAISTIGFTLLSIAFLPFFPRQNALNALNGIWATATSYLQDNFFELTANIAITLIILSVLRWLVQLIPLREARRSMLLYILRLIVVGFAVVIASPSFPGAGTAYLAGVSAFAVLAFSLSAQAAIGDVIAGFVLVFITDLEKEDWVCVGEVTGKLAEQNLFVHKIRTPKNVMVTLRNSTVLSSLISNFSASKKEKPAAPLIVHTTITLGYDVPWRKVNRVLLRAARKTAGLRHMPPPFILQTSLDDYYVSYELNVHTDEVTKLPRLYSRLHENIQDECNRAGIEILSPHYRAFRDGSDITIPVDDQGSSELSD